MEQFNLKYIFKIYFIHLLILSLVGCVQSGGTSGDAAQSPGAVTKLQTSNISPAAFNQGTQSIITLSYTDSDSRKATGCAISVLSNITETKACSCDAAGVCTVGVTGVDDYYGAASFIYRVAVGSEISPGSTASLAINYVADPPSVTNLTLSDLIYQGTESGFISLPYTDLDGDNTGATACTITSPTNVTVTTPCTCTPTTSSCKLKVTGSATYFGSASFSYQVTSHGLQSNIATVSFNIIHVDHAPTTTAQSPAVFNQDTQSIITLPYTDIDSDLANSCTVTNLNKVSITQACSCTGGVCTVGVTGLSNYYGSASFYYTVTANTKVSNSSIANLTIAHVNHAPTINTIPNMLSYQDQSATVNVVISDIDGPLTCSTALTATSSNAAIIANSGVTFSGTYPNCVATITPVPTKNGTVNLTFVVSDGVLTASTTYAHTIVAAFSKTWKLGDPGDTDTYSLSDVNIAKSAAGVIYLTSNLLNQTHATVNDFNSLPTTLMWDGANSMVKRSENFVAPFTETYSSSVIDAAQSTNWNSLLLKTSIPYGKGLPDFAAIAHLTLDETVAPLLEKYNSLSFALGGTPAPTYNVAGKINKSITFSGTQYFESPNSPYLNPDTQFSVCAWVKPASVTATFKSFLASRNTTSGYNLYVNTKFEFWIGNGVGYTKLVGTSTPSTATFSLVCGMFDGTTASLVVNGVIEKTAATAFVANTLKPTRVGAGTTETTAGEFFTGTIDDITIFNRALTTTELTSLNGLTVRVPQQNGQTLANTMFNNELITDYPLLSTSTLESSLIGLWHFDESSSATKVRNGATGLLEIPTGFSIGMAGKIGNSVALDGATSFLSSTTAVSTTPTTSGFTAMAWFKTASTGIQRILSFTTAQMPLGISGGKIYTTVNSINTTGTTTINDGKWHHVVITESAGTCTVYLDGNIGAAELSFACATATSFASTGFQIGRSATPFTQYFAGMLDEVAMWNRVLTTTEIYQLYKRGAASLTADVRTCTLSNCSDGVYTGAPFSELNNKDSLGNIYNTPLKKSFAVANNRYFQYKINLNSDVAAFGPDIKSVQVGPAHYVYSTADEFVTTTAISFKALSLFTESLGVSCAAGVRYQLSKDGLNWQYFNGVSWATGTSYATANTAAQLNSGLSLFTSAVPSVSDNLYVRAYLKSDGSNPCELNQMVLTGFN